MCHHTLTPHAVTIHCHCELDKVCDGNSRLLYVMASCWYSRLLAAWYIATALRQTHHLQVPRPMAVSVFPYHGLKHRLEVLREVIRFCEEETCRCTIPTHQCRASVLFYRCLVVSPSAALSQVLCRAAKVSWCTSNSSNSSPRLPPLMPS